MTNIDVLTTTQRNALTAAATGTLTVFVPYVDNGADPLVLNFAPLKLIKIRVNGIPLVESTDWTAGTDVATTATSIASAITTNTALCLCTASATGAVITITANSNGVSSIDLSSDEPQWVYPSSSVLINGALPTVGALVYDSTLAELLEYKSTGWVVVYDANASLTTAGVASSSNARYVTDAELVVIGNTSGTNTGDQSLSGLAPIASPTFTGTVTIPLEKNTAAQSTLTGTAGTAICSQPQQGSSWKKVVVYCSGYSDTATQIYTFPTAFSHTPVAVYTGAGIVATISTTTVAITSTTVTDFLLLEGY